MECKGQNLMQPGVDIKPNLTTDVAHQLVQDLYGLQVTTVTELNAYDDKNFHIIANLSKNPHINNVSSDGYVLKVVNSIDSENLPFIEGQTKLLFFLKENGVVAPTPIQNKKGEFFSKECIPSADGSQKFHIVRLLKFLPGTIFKSGSNYRPLYYEAGVSLAHLDNVLQRFHHPVFDKHTTIWHLKSVQDIKEHLDVIVEETRLKLVKDVLQSFNDHVMPKLSEFDKGMIHGDFNEQNILVEKLKDDGWKISAVLDFGDCNYAYYLFEIGAAMCYMMLEARSRGLEIIECAAETLRGYQSIRRMSELECSLLKITICSRLCQSLVLGLSSQRLQPDNAYIADTQASGWAVLTELWSTSDQVIQNAWPAILD